MIDHRLNHLRRKAAGVTGLSERTFRRHTVTQETLREIIARFEKEPAEKLAVVAKRLKVSRSSVLRWLNEGKIKGYKLFGTYFIPLDQPIDGFEATV